MILAVTEQIVFCKLKQTKTLKHKLIERHLKDLRIPYFC